MLRLLTSFPNNVLINCPPPFFNLPKDNIKLPLVQQLPKRIYRLTYSLNRLPHLKMLLMYKWNITAFDLNRIMHSNKSNNSKLFQIPYDLSKIASDSEDDGARHILKYSICRGSFWKPLVLTIWFSKQREFLESLCHLFIVWIIFYLTLLPF